MNMFQMFNISSKSPSVISNRMEQHHNFKWDKMDILDIKPSYN